MRLIDADKLNEDAKNISNENGDDLLASSAMNLIIELIAEQPDADVEIVKQIQNRKSAEQTLVKTSRSYLATPPDWLSDRAKKEYNRLYHAMKDMDMLGDLDANNLAAYCEAFDNYLIATEDIQTNGLTIAVDGEHIENPAVALQIKYSKEMREFGKQCGLSIDSRLKFAAAKLEKIEENIAEEFGDI